MRSSAFAASAAAIFTGLSALVTLAACMTLGIVGGSDPAAKAASITDLKAAVRKHLLEGR